MGAGSRLEAERPVGDFPYYSGKRSEWLRPEDRFIDDEKQTKKIGIYFENCGKISLTVGYERRQRIKENFIFDLSGKIKWPLTVNLRKNKFERKKIKSLKWGMFKLRCSLDIHVER